MTDASATPTGQALAKVEDPKTGKALVKKYEDSFVAVLPSHITRPETWIRLAQGALKKGRIQRDGRTDLEAAAANNPGVFLATLLDCARLGLEPGTEQYYLTARKVKGQPQILGIIGYQGLIELMYRAGAVDSVVAENVYENDTFQFRPGLDQVPVHEIDWDAEDRGRLRLVYAFARMKGGAVSKVVVLNRQAIERIKASSQGANDTYSPWQKHEPAMWLKSAVRQLAKWVPTSAEYRNQQLQSGAALEAQREVVAGDVGELPSPSEDVYPDDSDVVDAELVEWDPDDPERPFEVEGPAEDFT